MIMDYNRVVRDLNGYSKEGFLEKAAENFRVDTAGQSPYHPEGKGRFGMYLDGTWYRLTARPHILSEDAVDGLDVSLLQDHLLNPVLGIRDPKTDNRIDFVGGIRGLEELERRVRAEQERPQDECPDRLAVAFSMYPTSIGELFAVADAGKLMPPKSTWFEPKLRSGLFLHTLEER